MSKEGLRIMRYSTVVLDCCNNIAIISAWYVCACLRERQLLIDNLF